jgi:hypothetical protein
MFDVLRFSKIILEKAIKFFYLNCSYDPTKTLKKLILGWSLHISNPQHFPNAYYLAIDSQTDKYKDR